MLNTKEILGNLVKVEGVITAVLVGRDGLVIEAAGDSKTDVEAVGAMVTLSAPMKSWAESWTSVERRK